MQPPAFNRSIVEDLLGSNDPAVVATYVDLFRTTLEVDLMPRLEAALAAGDLKQMVFWLHSLKGVAAHAGAEWLVAEALDVERLLRRALSENQSITPDLDAVRAAAAAASAGVAALVAAAGTP
ncbi:MAG: Hpt domain-containing protein [Alphaproteobacteria bacterium]|nr:Hpt domain-containing protein [Alphaproteobacteria bacterium]